MSCAAANTGAVCKAAVPSHNYVLKLLSQQESVSVHITGLSLMSQKRSDGETYTSETRNCLYSAKNVNGTPALSYFKSPM